MNPEKSSEPGRDDGESATLGDLLYADKSKAVVPERDWVRLIECVAAGDQRALHAIYQRTRRIVFTLIMRITRNTQTAEEVMLDVFHDVWRRASSYDPAGGTVVGWIMNQARSRAIDRLRFEQRKKRVNTGGDDVQVTSVADSPEESFELREQGRLLRDAMMVLTAEEQRAIETAYFSELSYSEAAARLEQPIGTVKTRIRSGLEKLRQKLAAGMNKP